jgi:hypothetical protein
MCYRGRDTAEINTEGMEMTSHEKPGRYGERNYNPQHQSTSESEHSNTEPKNILGRVKTLLSA